MTHDFELRHLRVFVAVVEHGGITRAARALSVSQSTASESLAALERAVGEAVLERGRGVRLTAAGDALLPHARRLLHAADVARADIVAASTQARDVINVGTNPSIADVVLPAILAPLRQQMPNVRFEITGGMCTEIRAGVTSGRFALGLVVEPLRPDDDDSVRRITEDRLTLFCSPVNPHAGGELSVSQLASQRVYLSDAAGTFTGLLRRTLTAEGFSAEHLLTVGSVEGVRRAVLADPQSFGLLPRYLLTDALHARTIATVELRPSLPPIWLKILTGRRSDVERAPIRRLVDALIGVDLQTNITEGKPCDKGGKRGGR